MSFWNDKLNDKVNWREAPLPIFDDHESNETRPVENAAPPVPQFARQDRPRNPRALRIPTELLSLMLLVIAIGGAGILIANRDPNGGSPDGESKQAPIVISTGISSKADENQANSTQFPTIATINDYAGVVVCLDPGHGGADRGFVHGGSSSVAALKEAPLTLSLAQSLASELEADGFTVILTRSTDEAVNSQAEDTNHDGIRSAGATPAPGQVIPDDPDEVQARINICNEANADLMLSIHLGWSDNPQRRGATLWYSDSQPYAPLSKLLSAFIASDTATQMTATGYQGQLPQVAALQTGVDGRTETPDMLIIGSDSERLNRTSQMPAVFAEAMTISNDADVEALGHPEMRDAIVAGYRMAIERYVTQMLPEWRAMTDN